MQDDGLTRNRHVRFCKNIGSGLKLDKYERWNVMYKLLFQEMYKKQSVFRME